MKKTIDIIAELIPHPILQEIAGVLERGSRKEGDGVLTCHRPRIYYLLKFYKHLWYYAFDLLGGYQVQKGRKCQQDRDSKHHHLAHCIIRLLQLLGSELGVIIYKITTDGETYEVAGDKDTYK